MQKTTSKSNRNTLYLILSGFLVLACICIAALSAISGRSLVSPTSTFPPASKHLPITPTVTSVKTPAGLPGITPADIKVNLTDRDFTCTNVKETQAEGLGKWYSWYCDREEGSLISMHVEFMSRSLSSVDFIDATILQYSDPTDEVASLFLGYIATIAFIGNEEAQTEARLWVEEKLDQLNENCIEEIVHGIPINLCGPPTARFIEIGKMD